MVLLPIVAAGELPGCTAAPRPNHTIVCCQLGQFLKATVCHGHDHEGAWGGEVLSGPIKNPSLRPLAPPLAPQPAAHHPSNQGPRAGGSCGSNGCCTQAPVREHRQRSGGANGSSSSSAQVHSSICASSMSAFASIVENAFFGASGATFSVWGQNAWKMQACLCKSPAWLH